MAKFTLCMFHNKNIHFFLNNRSFRSHRPCSTSVVFKEGPWASGSFTGEVVRNADSHTKTQTCDFRTRRGRGAGPAFNKPTRRSQSHRSAQPCPSWLVSPSRLFPPPPPPHPQWRLRTPQSGGSRDGLARSHQHRRDLRLVEKVTVLMVPKRGSADPLH